MTLDDTIASPGRPYENHVDLLAFDKALNKLAKLGSQQSQIIELRYFGGLSVEDTSEFLGISQPRLSAAGLRRDSGCFAK